MLEPPANYSCRRDREDAGRKAYLAAFHAAQALITEPYGQGCQDAQGRAHPIARTDKKRAATRSELRQFLPQSYDMKSIADYGLGPGTDVPLERAAAAIDTAERLSPGLTSC